MSISWYYVDNNERVGPIQETEVALLIQQGKLKADSYVWRQGFDDWKYLKDTEELLPLLEEAQKPPPPQIEIPSLEPPDQGIGAIPALKKTFDWNHLGDEERILTIKIGHDRGSDEAEYGPFTVNQLKQAFQEERINEKTFVYTPGMDNWTLLGETPLFERLSGGIPASPIQEQERRMSLRRPFVAQVLCSDQNSVFQGICRDISIGGLQVLVAGFPGNVGNQVQINVHPENTEHCFVASGKVVRLLEGGAGFSLRFDNLNEEAINAIQNYINQT